MDPIVGTFLKLPSNEPVNVLVRVYVVKVGRITWDMTLYTEKKLKQNYLIIPSAQGYKEMDINDIDVPADKNIITNMDQVFWMRENLKGLVIFPMRSLAKPFQKLK